jgi:hypothetical protein
MAQKIRLLIGNDFRSCLLRAAHNKGGDAIVTPFLFFLVARR